MKKANREASGARRFAELKRSASIITKVNFDGI